VKQKNGCFLCVCFGFKGLIEGQRCVLSGLIEKLIEKLIKINRTSNEIKKNGVK